MDTPFEITQEEYGLLLELSELLEGQTPPFKKRMIFCQSCLD